MGSEAASYFMTVAASAETAVGRMLERGGAELVHADNTRVDYRLRDEHRYWIDVRVHRGPQLGVEIRIALTNDQWVIREPIERAFATLPPELAGLPLRDDDGEDFAVAGEEGWSRALEDDFGRRREAFVDRVGDFTAPISADHVYMYIHQTRWNRDNDAELAWQREREIAKLQEMWDKGEDTP